MPAARPTLVRGGAVVPMDRPRRILHPGSVLLDGAAIVAVGTVEELDADPRARDAEVLDATGHAVIPGLHNAHLHSGLLRGTAEGLVAVRLARHLRRPRPPGHDPGDRRGGVVALLRRERPVRHGLGDRHVAVHGGLGRAAGEHRDPGHPGPLRRRRGGLRLLRVDRVATAALLEAVARRPRRTGAQRGSASSTSSTARPTRFRAARDLAEEFGTGIHTHSSETNWEVEESLEALRATGPIEESPTAGVLGPTHRRGALRLARRRRARPPRRRPARRWPTARART